MSPRAGGRDVHEPIRMACPDEELILWRVAWGTTAVLVWAINDLWAEIRTRRRCFDPHASQKKVSRLPRVIEGPMVIRRATQADIDLFAEVGGRLPAGCKPSPRTRMEATA